MKTRSGSQVQVLMVVLLASACGRTDSASTSQNVFGVDARVTPPNAAPYTAIGRLDSGCTGELIGQRLVLTAAHCVIDSASGTVKPTFTYFRPNLRGGTSAEALWVDTAWVGTMAPESDRLNDWAVVRLEKAVGNTYGFLGVHSVAIGAALPYLTNLVGYSDDLNNGNDPSVHYGCYVLQVVNGELYHGCDGASGVSGGPLLNQINGNWYVVGITVSEFRQGASDSVDRDQWSSDYANVAIPVTSFLPAITTLLQTADAGMAAPGIAGVTALGNPNQRPTGQGPGSPSTPPDPAQLASLPTLLSRGPALKTLLLAMGSDTRALQALAAQAPTCGLMQIAAPLVADSDALTLALDNIFIWTAAATYWGQLYGLYNDFQTNAQLLQQVSAPPSIQGAFPNARTNILNDAESLESELFGP